VPCPHHFSFEPVDRFAQNLLLILCLWSYLNIFSSPHSRGDPVDWTVNFQFCSMAVSPPVMSCPNYKIPTPNCFFVVHNSLPNFLPLLHLSCNSKSSIVACSNLVGSEVINGTSGWGSFYNQPIFFKSLCVEWLWGINFCTGVMFYNFSLSHTQHGACQILGSSTAGNNEDAISCMPVVHQNVVPIAAIF